MKNKVLLLSLFVALSTTLMCQTPDFSLVGFAEGTTGGQGGSVVTVSDYSGLKFFAENSSPYIIYINGTIEHGEDGGSIRVRSNKTILGLGNSAFMFGVGFTINGNNNIIIRNIRFSMTGITTRTDKANVYSSTGDEGRPQILTNGGDCIRLTGSCYNVWIDHCEFFSEDPYVQTNQDLYDGIVDITGTSYNVTLSWNYVHDHHKVHLVGSSDTDEFDRRITFHHNYFYNLKGRLPFYRFGVGHVFNNYYLKCNSAINSRMEACLYVEKNYFENVSSNTVFDTGSTLTGFATLTDNYFINSKAPNIVSCSNFIPSYTYNQVLTDVAEVKNVVMNYAGVGKIVTGLEDVKILKHSYRIDDNKIIVNTIEQPQLSLLDASGKIILQRKYNELIINTLPHGFYILRISENSTQTENIKITL